MKKLHRIAVICFSIALCSTVFLPLPASAAEDETEAGLPDIQFISDFQNLTDAVENLSEDSTAEDIEEVIQLFENTDFGSEDTENEDGSSLAGSMSIDNLNLGPSGSIQLLFAKLQLESAEIARSQALEQMKSIQIKQDEMTRASNYRNEAYRLQNKAKIASDEKSAITAELQNYLEEKDLYLPESKVKDEKNRNKYSEEEWQLIIDSLEGYLHTMDSSSQTQMAYIQDFIKQYNDYLQGANSSIEEANQVLTSVARGQTMLGGSSTGLMVTGVLAGIIVGIAGTLLVIRLRKRREKDAQ